MNRIASYSTTILSVLCTVIASVFVFALIGTADENAAEILYNGAEGLSIGIYDSDSPDVSYYGGMVVKADGQTSDSDALENIATVSGVYVPSTDGYLEAALKSQVLSGGSLSDEYIGSFLNSVAREGSVDPALSEAVKSIAADYTPNESEQSEKAGVLFAKAIKKLIVFVTGKDYYSGGTGSIYGDDIIADEIKVPLSDKPAEAETSAAAPSEPRFEANESVAEASGEESASALRRYSRR